MPPSLDDWLPNDQLARYVIAVVETLDLSAFYARRRADGWGRAAYDPKMMVALLIYAYATGARSSRLIERRCVEDVACRFISVNETPDRATIAAASVTTSRIRIEAERIIPEGRGNSE